MLITYHGHAEFLLETANGRRILFDPYDEKAGYPMKRVRADAVLVSHHHFDHDYVDKVDGKPVVIDQKGAHKLLEGVRVTGFPSFHDDKKGAQRGQILCHLVEADGLKVAHLGDLGIVPDEGLKSSLFMPDILFIPVGGFFTIDAAQARETIDLLKPRVAIPMHYRNDKGGFDRISTLAPFLDAMKPLQASFQPILRVTQGDLSQQPRLVVLDIQPEVPRADS
ncbi:MAG: MBL fold metallo-hydrolase [Eubacteriales bacterium]|jgi:L-ascorbate metabolism protein UlaG (beta-lactamase superfamily)|nr:MBL fold metallo-hydrolase [Eubacteriales bacterium]MDD3573186.1 MBL fold metallo-hydrolase [Eubacteriales bacterium]MDD4135318.1 MBL fold metallo-hydrolase [Eubacteriales bacterium]NLO14342.1 MBL fold metallo-hydrolase [Clostridiales bacterium]